MAILHQAELRPTKLELLTDWASAQSWFVGEAGVALEIIASFRFDDPEGEVGVETLLFRAGGTATMQVPFTYRGAPLAGGDSHLIGTLEHSVLGKRWVYDGVGDPVYLQTVTNTALNGGHQAELILQTADGSIKREPNALVSGTGTSTANLTAPSVGEISVQQVGDDTVVSTSSVRVLIHRVIPEGEHKPTENPEAVDNTEAALRGSWTGSSGDRELARVALAN